MRVLYFHQHFTTPSGAGGTRSYEMARRLIAHGHAVTMVCGSPHHGSSGAQGPAVRGLRRGKVDGIDVVEIVLPYSNYDSFLRRAWTFIRFAVKCVGIGFREPFDLVFATSTPLTIAIPGVLVRLLRRKPFVFEVRDLWPELPKAMGVIKNPLVLMGMSGLEWAAYHAASRCIGLSPGMVEGIGRRGIPRERIAMVPNGADLDLFRPLAKSRSLPGVAATDFLAVFAGAHGIANGVDMILDAAAALKKRGASRIKIALIGDGRCKPALRERASREGLDNVLFFDPMPKRQLAQVLGSADVGLMTLQNVSAFYYGTSPNKFFDYIASGLAVVNNYPGWLAELIHGAGCGVVCPPGDASAFADSLEALSSDPARVLQMGVNARRLAESQFSRDKLGDDFVRVLESAAPRLDGLMVASP
jgi:glycosyltransferase involved in cell wall biosynthesis